VALADVNRDGAIDVALAVDDKLLIYRNRGDGTFLTPLSYPVSITFGSGAVASGDFNHDGFPDFIVGFVGDGSDASQMFINNGNGTFTPLSVQNAGFGTFFGVDLNKDGYDDIVTQESITTMVNKRSFVPSDWRNSFTITDICTCASEGAGMVVADLTGDGYPDIVSAAGSNGQRPLRYYVNNGDGTFGPSQGFRSAPWSASTRAMVAADFDGDGALDLAAASDNQFFFARNLGGGGFPVVQVAPYAVSPSSPPTSGFNIVALDLNDDGQRDLVIFAGGTPQDFFLVALNQTNPSGPIRLPSIVPDHGGNTGTVTVTLSLTTAVENPAVRLTSSSGVQINALSVGVTTYHGASVVAATFDLIGSAVGKYDVSILADGTVVAQIPEVSRSSRVARRILR
jgi:hypothetical protein